MKRVSFFVMLFAIVSFYFSCNGQSPANKSNQNTNRIVGGGCDGCEIMYEGMPAVINATDTSQGWHEEEGEKLFISGIVYKADGKTPAPDIIIYYWHTDNKGFYSPRAAMPEKAKRHGHLRGWMKTGADGKYALYTIRPAPYPGATEPAHIHLLVKEPGIANEYYVDELVFDDDKFLTVEKRKRMGNRGGSGILKLVNNGRVQTVNHTIILGMNIPDYPQQSK